MADNIEDLIPEGLRSFKVTMVKHMVTGFSSIVFAKNEDEVKSFYKKSHIFDSDIEILEIDRARSIYEPISSSIFVKIGEDFFRIGKRYTDFKYTMSGLGIDDPHEIDMSLVGNEWSIEVKVDPVLTLLGGYTPMPDYLLGMKKGIQKTVGTSIKIYLSSQDDYMKALLSI